VRVQGEAARRLGRDRHPAVPRDLAQELTEQIKEAIEGATEREVAHLRGDDGLEQRLVEIRRDAIPDVEPAWSQLGEEPIRVRSVRDRAPQRTHEIPHAPPDHVGGGASLFGPEAVALTVGSAQDDGHVFGRRFRAQQAT
jgi:hypothetical protein